MHQHTQDPITYFTFESYPQDRLTHGVLSRLGGVSPAPHSSLNLSSSRPDDPAAIEENRSRAYGSFGRSTQTLVHAHLIHKAHVTPVTAAHHGQVMPDCDGLITNDVGCGLTMNYADCAPVLLYDPVQHAIGLGHAGWQGTVQDVPGAMVRAMQTNYGSRPQDMLAAVGPCITAEVYEVGQNVIDAVAATFPNNADRLLLPQTGRERPHFDLPNANRINFERAGVGQIELSNLCTAQDNHLFFSHRAEKGKTGRFGVVFILEAR